MNQFSYHTNGCWGHNGECYQLRRLLAGGHHVSSDNVVIEWQHTSLLESCGDKLGE